MISSTISRMRGSCFGSRRPTSGSTKLRSPIIRTYCSDPPLISQPSCRMGKRPRRTIGQQAMERQEAVLERVIILGLRMRRRPRQEVEDGTQALSCYELFLAARWMIILTLLVIERGIRARGLTVRSLRRATSKGMASGPKTGWWRSLMSGIKPPPSPNASTLASLTARLVKIWVWGGTTVSRKAFEYDTE